MYLDICINDFRIVFCISYPFFFFSNFCIHSDILLDILCFYELFVERPVY